MKKAINKNVCGVYSCISEYTRFKDCLFIQDGAVMYKDRVIIPTELRPAVLETLHAAHQGTSSMQLRAQKILFWPGMSNDIERRRAHCLICNQNAPSQSQLPSNPSPPPSTPFQHIFADFFDFNGRHYLVAGDRLSGFSEVFLTPTGTSNSGARGLVACLRKWFETFGVPEQLSSDGGPEFSADTTQAFFKTWGVNHRMSDSIPPSIKRPC